MCDCEKKDPFAGDCCSHKKFDPTKPVQTRDGRKARILCTDKKGSKPIVYLIENRDGRDESFNTCTVDGKAMYPDNDLVNVPERTVRYVNIYDLKQTKPDTSYMNGAVGFLYTNPEAGKAAIPYSATQVKLTFEDGKLVDSEVIR